MSNKKQRGGWTNPASAANGRKAAQSPNTGRPRVKTEFRRGETLIIERQPIAITPGTPMTPPEQGVVLNVGADEIEIQIGNDILTLRRPDKDK